MGNIDDVKPYIEQADYLISTSLHEGTPNVILEAMAIGTPVFALYHEGISLWIEEEILIKITSVHDMKWNLLRGKINDVEKARRYLQRVHSFENVLDEFSGLINFKYKK